MQRFAFQLERVLTFRRSLRDRCRAQLAHALARDRELVALRNRAAADRQSQIDELRVLSSPGDVNVDAGLSRRHYAGLLAGDIGAIERERQTIFAHIEACRKALLAADQAVKALERLSEKRRDEYNAEAEHRELRDLEESWRSLNAVGLT
jgi:flagellar export protein FliJ